MCDKKIVIIELLNCMGCPHVSRGFLSEPDTCVYGDRKKTPYDFLCDKKVIPGHCPLPNKITQVTQLFAELSDDECLEVTEDFCSNCGSSAPDGCQCWNDE